MCMHGQLGSLEGEKGRRVGFAIANTPVNHTTAQHMAHMAAQGEETPRLFSLPPLIIVMSADSLLYVSISWCAANGAVAFRVALRDESAYAPLPVQWLLRLTLQPQGEGSLESWTYVAKVDMHTPHDTVRRPSPPLPNEAASYHLTQPASFVVLLR